MSSFEKHEMSQPETTPKVDFKLVLENGEVIDSWPLESAYFDVIVIKDDGKGLFRPEEDVERKRPLRVQLELLAGLVDSILKFGFVPEVVARKIGKRRGTLQRYISEAKPAMCGGGLLGLVSNEEIIRASLFEYLIGAADRHYSNILLSEDGTKIWLIDHDDFMFIEAKPTDISWRKLSSKILDEAASRNLNMTINEELVELLKKLVEKLDGLLNDSGELGAKKPNPGLLVVIKGVKQRAGAMLENKMVPLLA